MNILILSNMSSPNFIEDFKLGNYLISKDNKVLIADIVNVNSSMNSIYDVVLYRNFVPQSIAMYSTTKELFLDKIKLIPNITKAYGEYKPEYYIDIANKLGLSITETSQGKCMAYGKDMPSRFILTRPDDRFITQKLYDMYYHIIVCNGKIILSYAEHNGKRVSYDAFDPELTDIISAVDYEGIYEIIYVFDDRFRLSFIDTRYVAIYTDICINNDESYKIYDHIIKYLISLKKGKK